MVEDYDLIEASFAQQYGIRLRKEDEMPWGEFCSLLSGLMPDTPLGQIVSIRAEKDLKRIKTFTKEQKRIHDEWLVKKVQRLKGNKEDYRKSVSELQEWCKMMFSQKGNR